VDPSPTWTLCANEGQTCTVPGTKQVRYGVNGTFLYRTVTDSIACTNAAFGGDPVRGVVKRCELATVSTGTVSWFNSEKGYGFITPDGGGPSLFVQYSDIIGNGFRDLASGQRVSFEVVNGLKGPQAINVQKL
jgi:CspA family cold shock protein